jgi:hypothetical protein
VALDRTRVTGGDLALVLLAVAAVGLAFVALDSTGSDGSVEQATVAVAVDPTATGAPSTASEPTESASALPVVDRITRPLRAGAVDLVAPTVAWRAGAQRCDRGDEGVLEVTADAGRSWRPVDFPLREVLALDAQSVDDITLHGLDNTCVFSSVRTTDRGASWDPVTDVDAAVWTYSPRDSLRVAGVPVDAPCDGVRDVTRAGRSSAFVLCAQGLLVQTVDSGATFEPVGNVPNAVAVASENGRFVVAAVIDPACDGLRIDRSDDSGATWSPDTCVAGASADGPVGLAVVDRDVMLIAGADSFVTTDGTWPPTP